MNDEKLRHILSILPEQEDVRTRARRARRKALAQLDRRKPARHWLWAPALALVLMLVIGAVWISRVWRVEPLVWQPPAPVIVAVPAPPPVKTPVRRRIAPRPKQDRLQVQMVLSDGTRVLWTFDKNFNL